ncbi:hypothetical protein OH77DRAFT_1185586 [Trametes cingulata]|nr:hypothetical protein OH77DRAFT_1185586 [Trametes cingulata]
MGVRSRPTPIVSPFTTVIISVVDVPVGSWRPTCRSGNVRMRITTASVQGPRSDMRCESFGRRMCDRGPVARLSPRVSATANCSSPEGYIEVAWVDTSNPTLPTVYPTPSLITPQYQRPCHAASSIPLKRSLRTRRAEADVTSHSTDLCT